MTKEKVNIFHTNFGPLNNLKANIVLDKKLQLKANGYEPGQIQICTDDIAEKFKRVAPFYEIAFGRIKKPDLKLLEQILGLGYRATNIDINNGEEIDWVNDYIRERKHIRQPGDKSYYDIGCAFLDKFFKENSSIKQKDYPLYVIAFAAGAFLNQSDFKYKYTSLLKWLAEVIPFRKLAFDINLNEIENNIKEILGTGYLMDFDLDDKSISEAMKKAATLCLEINNYVLGKGSTIIMDSVDKDTMEHFCKGARRKILVNN